jgi:hypothetical protein
MNMNFTVVAASGERSEKTVDIGNLVIAGLTGRDRKAVEEHIHELQEIGVPPPSTIPIYYRATAENLMFLDRLQVLGGGTSGEAEVVFIDTGDDILIAAGSDHTDRDLEAHSVPASKQICAKPVSREAWRLADVEAHWDELTLSAWATIDGERVLYQQGTLAGLLPPRELFRIYGDGAERLAPGTAMFGGTLAAIGGVRPGDTFEVELHDPRLGRTLKVAYEVEALPIVA